MATVNNRRHRVREEIRMVVGTALAFALLVGGIADTVAGTFTTIPYQVGGLFGAMIGLLLGPD